MAEPPQGKLTARDVAVSRLLTWAPWLAFLLAALPLPMAFLLLLITAATTESAALYLFLSLLSLGFGLFVGLLAVIFLFVYRNRWLRRLRDRLAADGITANEVAWFRTELTSTERKALAEMQGQNQLLADAYLETLASRLTATRIKMRAGQELVRVERRINLARSLAGVDTADLLRDLESDRERYEQLKKEASDRLVQAKARLQTIEAAASRSLNQIETDLMLRRLSAAQEQLPLVMEMAKLDQHALEHGRLGIDGTGKQD